MYQNPGRIIPVDILRGFALLGILLAHFIYWHTGGPLPNYIYSKNFGIASGIVGGINGLLIFGKFFIFFAFLFGVSFHLQLQGLQKSGTRINIRFARRLFILFVIGIIHHFFWMGDILSIYALLGFSLLFFRGLSTKGLLIWGIIFGLAIPNKLWDVFNFLFFHAQPNQDFESSAQAYFDVVKSGTLWQIITFNASQLWGKASFQLLGGRASSTIGFFLLGIWAARLGLLQTTQESRQSLSRILKKCLLFCGVLLVIAGILFAANEIFTLGLQNNPVAGFFFGVLFDSFNAALVMVYISGLALLLYRPFWQKMLGPLQYIGKVALSSYLLQTVFGLLLFYQVGAGLFLKTTPAENWVIALLLFLVQVWLAKWWLSHFYYGPVEWLWRSATIGKMQPFSRKK